MGERRQGLMISHPILWRLLDRFREQARSHRNTTHPMWERSHLWRGSLLPLGREAAPKNGTATQSSGSKLPRHRVR
ncbi:hypothetical protein FCH79_20320 [Pseudomonas koreensis]|nr:hypothetical protein [Pseudomonas koreensis]